MLWIIAIVNVIYAPMMIFLRNPPAKEEKQVRDWLTLRSIFLTMAMPLMSYIERYKFGNIMNSCFN